MELVVIRHGARAHDCADPLLYAEGEDQAAFLADYFHDRFVLKEKKRVVLYSSPFIRALQTSAPLAAKLDVKIKIEYKMGELMAVPWLFKSDPYEKDLNILHNRDHPKLPLEHIDDDYTPEKSAGFPEYPDVNLSEGARCIPGEAGHRVVPVRRHKEALFLMIEANMKAAEEGGGIVLAITAHGCTHDYVVEALIGSAHLVERHVPYCVGHCSLTVLEKSQEDLSRTSALEGWTLKSFGEDSYQPEDKRSGFTVDHP